MKRDKMKDKKVCWCYIVQLALELGIMKRDKMKDKKVKVVSGRVGCTERLQTGLSRT